MNDNDDNNARPEPVPKPDGIPRATRKATLVRLLADVYASAGLSLRDASAAAVADYVCLFTNSTAAEAPTRVEARTALCA